MEEASKKKQIQSGHRNKRTLILSILLSLTGIWLVAANISSMASMISAIAPGSGLTGDDAEQLVRSLHIEAQRVNIFDLAPWVWSAGGGCLLIAAALYCRKWLCKLFYGLGALLLIISVVGLWRLFTTESTEYYDLNTYTETEVAYVATEVLEAHGCSPFNFTDQEILADQLRRNEPSVSELNEEFSNRLQQQASPTNLFFFKLGRYVRGIFWPFHFDQLPGD